MGTKVKKCVIISGAPETDLSYYNEYINDDCYIICADNGYKKCEELNIIPDLVIGDFDSSPCPSNAKYDIINLQVRKDDTDTFHCVLVAEERGFSDICILGGIGSRVDHTYSNILSVNYCFERNISCILVNANNRISIFKNDKHLEKGNYTFFSMFAFLEDCKGLTMEGALYNLNNYDLIQNNQICQSNEFLENSVHISCKSGKILLIESND